MDQPTRKLVIVGGGTAGWLTACLVAAQARTAGGQPPDVTLVESPDVPRIGVGEGTWPSMRATLQAVGIPESDLLRRCDASLKQGTEFRGWSGSAGEDAYYHPFSLPAEYSRINLAAHWLRRGANASFAAFVTPQAQVIAAGLAPKQAAMPDYAFAVNYGYHFDAGRFADLLHEHAVHKLGVRYIAANVTSIVAADNGDIAAVALDTGARVDGDLFVDCTGQRSLLLGEHLGVGFVSVKKYLVNDRAIVVQVPHVPSGVPLPSVTRATARRAGWIWDIGLQSRRGLGYVHSSSHLDEGTAMAELAAYVDASAPGVRQADLAYRDIPFEPGYRQEFWVQNCVAVGLSGGFIEPLEASALAQIEQAANLIGRQFPANREIMAVTGRRFNARMHYNWQRVVEFLKLHYAISRRADGAYWQDHRDESTWPGELADKLTLWRQQPPWHDDAPRVDELFPSASYQYVLYGMGFRPDIGISPVAGGESERADVDRLLRENEEKTRQYLSRLPANRELLASLTALAGVA